MSDREVTRSSNTRPEKEQKKSSTVRNKSQSSQERAESTGKSSHTVKKASIDEASSANRAGSNDQKKRLTRAERERLRKARKLRQRLITGSGIAVFVILLFFLISGCGVNHSSPEGVVRSWVQAVGKQNLKEALNCYGKGNESSESLQTELETEFAYYRAHGANRIQIHRCDTLYQEGDLSYVYVLYGLVLDNDQEYPCLNTFMVKKTKRRYDILPPSGVTDDISALAAAAYKKFMSTDIYKNYSVEYNTFIKKNPGYEERIEGVLELT